MPALTTGTHAPDVKLTTTHGATFLLEEALARGPVLLAFFKVSCPVCQFTFPYLERLYKTYESSSVTIVGVCQNPKQEAEAFVKEYGVTFPVLLDDPKHYAVSNAYGLTNVPTLFFIAPDGEVEHSVVGWSRQEIEAIGSRIAALENHAAVPLFKAGEDIPDFKAG